MKRLHEREWSDKKRSSDRTEDGKCTNVTNRRSRAALSTHLFKPKSNALMALCCSSFSLSFMLSLRIFRESKASSMYFFAFSILRIWVWKQTFSPGKDERYRLPFHWRFNTLSQSEIRVHWSTHNPKSNVFGQAGIQLDSSPILSRLGHSCFSTKTKALAREIPPVTQATCSVIVGKLWLIHEKSSKLHCNVF